MTDDAPLDELVSVWQREKARGRDLPATEVCRDCPELAGALGRRIAALRFRDASSRPADATVAPIAVPAASLPVTAEAHAPDGTHG
jgi:hypothetical protein